MEGDENNTFDWDDTIEKDSDEYPILPEGEYPFLVKKFERGFFDGSAKLPPCKQAILSIEVDGGEHGKTTIEHSLFLAEKTEGFLCAFFTAIGQRKRKQRLAMNWQSVPGSTGRCKVYIDTWNHKTTGQEMKSNKIRRFLEPAPAAASPAAATHAASPTGF